MYQVRHTAQSDHTDTSVWPTVLAWQLKVTTGTITGAVLGSRLTCEWRMVDS
jgi:hypothetical protein